MKTIGLAVRVVLAGVLLMGCGMVAEAGTQDVAARAAQVGVLTKEQVAAVLPASVFYRGQSATVQARNSGGFRLAGGELVLAALVDTGGYSTAVQQTYQAYLITEVALQVGGKTLAPGAYGFGFVAGDKMVVMDLGANEIMNTATVRDTALARPTPLKMIADGAGGYRLYLGRAYVTLMPQTK